MKKFFLALGVILLVFTPLTAFALTDEQELDITKQIKEIEAAISLGQSEPIIEILSPNAPPELTSEIEEMLDGRQFSFSQLIRNFSEDEGFVKVSVSIDSTVKSQSGATSTLTNVPSSYTFEYSDNKWLLLDSTVFEKLGPGYLLKVFIWIAIIGLPILLIIVIIAFRFGSRRKEFQFELELGAPSSNEAQTQDNKTNN